MYKSYGSKIGLTLLELTIVIAVVFICAAPLLYGLSAVSFQGARAEFYNVANPMCEGIMEEFLKYDYFDRNFRLDQIGGMPYCLTDANPRDIKWLVRWGLGNEANPYCMPPWPYSQTDFAGYKFSVQFKFISPNYSGNLNEDGIYPSGPVLPNQEPPSPPETIKNIDRSNFLRIRVVVTHDKWPDKKVEAVTIVTPSRSRYYRNM